MKGNPIRDRSPQDVLALYPRHSNTLASLLSSRARVSPDGELLVFEGTSLSYAEVERTSARAAAMLLRRGIRVGDRVAVMSRNHPSTVICFMALARIGAIMVPINPDYRADEARYILSHAEVSGILCSPVCWDTLAPLVRDLSHIKWVLLNQHGDPALQVFDEVLASEEPPGTPPEPDAGETCVLIYTSGTTGFPKGAMHSQRNVVLAGEGFVARMHLQPSDRLLGILPMFHVNALFYSLMGTLAAGATLVLLPQFSASTFWRTVADTGATEVNTIAAITMILMRRPRHEFVAGHTLKKLYGAPLDQDTCRVFQAEFGVPTMIEGYGMSEVPGILSNPFEGPRKVGSMGKPSAHPDPNIGAAEVQITDEHGTAVDDETVGEIRVRSPLVMKGYFRDPAQTSAAFVNGWFMTGDLAWRDSDGYFWFVARKNDIIRKRGENISGAELDRVIGAHPDVEEVAAIAIPSEVGEDEVLAVIVRRPASQLTAAEVAHWCKQHLTPNKVPRYVVFVDTLPHTPTHRVAKAQVRADPTLRARAVDVTA